MAQYRLDNQQIGQPGNRYEIMMVGTIDGEVVTAYNPLPTYQVGATATSAFGEPLGITLTPVIQADAIYGLNPREWETYTTGNGAVVVNNSVITVSSGTAVGSYGVLRTKQLLRYRPGQGALARFTAAFPTPNTYVTQRAGFLSQEQSLMVGYDGDNFGVVRINEGKADIRLLTILTNAAFSETATITLNGNVFSIPLVAGNTESVASQISVFNFGSSWITEQVGSGVKIASTINGAKSNTYAFSSNGSATATYSQIQTGATDIQNWTYQTNFNIDTLDGSGNTATNPSGMLISPEFMNVFQINYRWLGVGEIRYAVENPSNGQLIFFHKEHHSGAHLTPHLDNPSMRLGYVSANKSANVCANTTVKGICMMGAIEGMRNTHGHSFSKSVSKSSLTSATNHHVLSIRNPYMFDGKFNLKNVRLRQISVAYQGNDPVELYLILNPTYNTQPLWTNINASESIVYYSDSTSTITMNNNSPLTTYIVPINGGVLYDVADLNIELSPNTQLSFVVKSGQNIASISLAATWVEE